MPAPSWDYLVFWKVCAMKNKSKKGLTLVELVCAVAVLALVAGGLMNAISANVGLSNQAHVATLAAFEAQFQMERITGIAWSGVDTDDPMAPGQVFDMLSPFTRIVTAPPWPGEYDAGIASWGDRFLTIPSGRFFAKVTREQASNWGELGELGDRGPGVLMVEVHIFLTEDCPDDRPILTLEGAVTIDPEMNLIATRIRNSGRFDISSGATSVNLAGAGVQSYNSAPGNILGMAGGNRVIYSFTVFDEYLDEYFPAAVILDSGTSPGGPAGYYVFASSCRLRGEGVQSNFGGFVD